MRIFENVKFDTSPILIAAWPGIGNVGIMTANYIREKIGAYPFAEIDMKPYFVPELVVVNDGIADFPKPPASIIYYKRNPDLLVFESNVQITGRDGLAIAKSLIRLAAYARVKRLYTLAALPVNTTHKVESQIYGAFTEKNVLEEFERKSVIPLTEGCIAGHNGLLLGLAKEYNIEAGCFLGTVPVFAANTYYPKASLKIIELFEDLLEIEIDKTSIKEKIMLVNEHFNSIEDKIKEFPYRILQPETNVSNPIDDILSDNSLNGDEPIPEAIMEKIERLFQDAANDRNKAVVLKKELDRWNVYELYEDRFLKLFK
ncbi:MAG: PAC2 family protein [Chitinispirillales bacterium]|nr:PAC2 family protein [Chitinispirillales bacterium]